MGKSVPVYASGVGELCRGCGRPIRSCGCRTPSPARTGKSASPADGVVRVARETKGRKGKGVTLVTGLPLAVEALEVLARDLKRLCGTGGTVKDGVIEIQGEHRDRLVEELQTRGYRVKRAGG